MLNQLMQNQSIHIVHCHLRVLHSCLATNNVLCHLYTRVILDPALQGSCCTLDPLNFQQEGIDLHD